MWKVRQIWLPFRSLSSCCGITHSIKRKLNVIRAHIHEQHIKECCNVFRCLVTTTQFKASSDAFSQPFEHSLGEWYAKAAILFGEVNLLLSFIGIFETGNGEQHYLLC